jgi:hypothetical protein
MSRRVKPHQVRGRELEEVREKDPDGRIVYHHRTVDTLGKMLRAGTITQEMHDAGKDFEAAFIVANLDPLRALPILRVPGTGREPELNERQVDARRRVHQSLEALGGISSPAGSCVWHVVGLQRSVRACGSGRCVKAGVAGRCARSRRRASWWRRWGCWRVSERYDSLHNLTAPRPKRGGSFPARLSRCCGAEPPSWPAIARIAPRTAFSLPSAGLRQRHRGRRDWL